MEETEGPGIKEVDLKAVVPGQIITISLGNDHPQFILKVENPARPDGICAEFLVIEGSIPDNQWQERTLQRCGIPKILNGARCATPGSCLRMASYGMFAGLLQSNDHMIVVGRNLSFFFHPENPGAARRGYAPYSKVTSATITSV